MPSSAAANGARRALQLAILLAARPAIALEARSISSQRAWLWRTNSVICLRPTSRAAASLPPETLGKRMFDVMLAAVELAEQLVDCVAFLQHRARAASATSAAEHAPLRRAAARSPISLRPFWIWASRSASVSRCLIAPIGIFRIAADQLMHRRLSVDLRLHQRLDALAHAVEPQLKRLRRPAAAAPRSRRAKPRPGLE